MSLNEYNSKARRIQSNLLQDKAAALFVVSQQTVMRIDHGITSRILETVLQICFAYPVSPDLPYNEESPSLNAQQAYNEQFIKKLRFLLLLSDVSAV